MEPLTQGSRVWLDEHGLMADADCSMGHERRRPSASGTALLYALS